MIIDNCFLLKLYHTIVYKYINDFPHTLWEHLFFITEQSYCSPPVDVDQLHIHI